MLNIPLVSLPKGRGEVGQTISLMYNSKLYDTTVEEDLDQSEEMAFQNFLKSSENGGWNYSTNNQSFYYLDVISRFETIDWFDCNGSNAGKNAFSIKVVMRMPDGSRNSA